MQVRRRAPLPRHAGEVRARLQPGGIPRRMPLKMQGRRLDLLKARHTPTDRLGHRRVPGEVMRMGYGDVVGYTRHGRTVFEKCPECPASCLEHSGQLLGHCSPIDDSRSSTPVSSFFMLVTHIKFVGRRLVIFQKPIHLPATILMHEHPELIECARRAVSQPT